MAEITPKKISELTAKDIASITDHTFLKTADFYAGKLAKGTDFVEARESAFREWMEKMAHHALVPYTVCVRPFDVPYAKERISRSGLDIKVCSVVGFPDGAWINSDLKLAETEYALNAGADEIDTVINYQALTRNDYTNITDELNNIIGIAHHRKALVKVILETSRLNNEQITWGCQICDELGADFVKTSTGYSIAGANIKDLKLMSFDFPRGVKASGGITATNVREMLYAMSRRDDDYIVMDPMKVRLGASSLLDELLDKKTEWLSHPEVGHSIH